MTRDLKVKLAGLQRFICFSDWLFIPHNSEGVCPVTETPTGKGSSLQLWSIKSPVSCREKHTCAVHCTSGQAVCPGGGIFYSNETLQVNSLCYSGKTGSCGLFHSWAAVVSAISTDSQTLSDPRYLHGFYLYKVGELTLMQWMFKYSKLFFV